MVTSPKDKQKKVYERDLFKYMNNELKKSMSHCWTRGLFFNTFNKKDDKVDGALMKIELKMAMNMIKGIIKHYYIKSL